MSNEVKISQAFEFIPTQLSLRSPESFEKPGIKIFRWKEHLDQWSNTKKYNSNKLQPQLSVKRIRECKKIYSVNELPSFLPLLDKKKARFVLSELNADSIKFAKEGKSDETVPCHVEMAKNGCCFSAGTVCFNKKGLIREIDHESGGFTPSFASLRPFLHFLAEKELLAEKFTLVQRNSAGKVEVRIKLTPADLKKLKPLVIAPVARVATENNDPHEEISEGPAKKRRLANGLETLPQAPPERIQFVRSLNVSQRPDKGVSMDEAVQGLVG